MYTYIYIINCNMYIYNYIHIMGVCSVCLYADVEICVCIDCIIQFMHCTGLFGHCI